MSFEQRVVQLEETNAELVKEVVRVRDAAAGLNRMYSSVTEGRNSVGDGQYFVVPGEGTYQRLYRRSGSSADLIAEYPSVEAMETAISEGVDEAEARATVEADRAEAEADRAEAEADRSKTEADRSEFYADSYRSLREDVERIPDPVFTNLLFL